MKIMKKDRLAAFLQAVSGEMPLFLPVEKGETTANRALKAVHTHAAMVVSSATTTTATRAGRLASSGACSGGVWLRFSSIISCFKIRRLRRVKV